MANEAKELVRMALPIAVAKQIIQEARYLALATTSPDSRPWCSPLHYGVTADLRFVFISSKASRHAENIRETGLASWAIYWGEKSPEETDGVMFEGTARELEGGEAEKYGNILYDQRFPDPAERAEHSVDLAKFAATGRAFYLLAPVEAWKVDKEDPHGVSRTQVDLQALSRLGIAHPPPAT